MILLSLWWAVATKHKPTGWSWVDSGTIDEFISNFVSVATSTAFVGWRYVGTNTKERIFCPSGKIVSRWQDLCKKSARVFTRLPFSSSLGLCKVSYWRFCSNWRSQWPAWSKDLVITGTSEAWHAICIMNNVKRLSNLGYTHLRRAAGVWVEWLLRWAKW